MPRLSFVPLLFRLRLLFGRLASPRPVSVMRWLVARLRLYVMTADLSRTLDGMAASVDLAAEPTYISNTAREDYLAAVEKAKEEIRAGEAFQVVVSQRFAMETSASALDIYRVLRV